MNHLNLIHTLSLPSGYFFFNLEDNSSIRLRWELDTSNFDLNCANMSISGEEREEDSEVSEGWD
ncbi:MAG: hypothetical protein CMA29_05275 [Euryarchaeota archaeon]|nr:hypothetical protein [Euryarchaeota archaeon]